MTIYRFGLRGNYGLCGTKKHGFRTKKHRKARKMRQKTDVVRFGTKMSQVQILSFRPPAVPVPKQWELTLLIFYLHTMAELRYDYSHPNKHGNFGESPCPFLYRSKKDAPDNFFRYLLTKLERYDIIKLIINCYGCWQVEKAVQ